MKIVIDMNLSPVWVKIFEERGWIAHHWSAIGEPRAADSVIMEWARSHGYIVFTHDLDFGTILATTQANSPSVIQIRTQDVTPDHLAPLVLKAISQYQHLFEKGVLIVVDEYKLRARILPLTR